MLLIPYENFKVITRLKPDEVKFALQKTTSSLNATKTRWGGGYSAEGSFFGQVTHSEFDIQQVISYRNSFAPVITGMIDENLAGSIIHIKMKLPRFALVFITIAAIFLTAALISQIIKIKADGADSPMMFAPAIMILFIYLMTILSFKYESRRAKSDLLNIFEGEIQ